jgi:hypothetical protein
MPGLGISYPILTMFCVKPAVFRAGKGIFTTGMDDRIWQNQGSEK